MDTSVTVSSDIDFGIDDQDATLLGTAMPDNEQEGVESDPCQQVITNDDLLPLILSEFKELAVGSDNGLTWKRHFIPLLLVNRAFFYATADILWHTMDSLTPVYSLLPWFKNVYTGIGNHKYAGSADWEDFSLYASRIQRFRLESQPTIVASTAAFMELFTLPGRPDPFFPALTSVVLSSEALTGIPSLFLLVSPSMRNLEVKTAEPSSSYYKKSSSKLPPENLMNALPALSYVADELKAFNYTGPVSEDFFDRLSSFTALQSLSLVVVSNAYLGLFQKLHSLALLRNISLTIPFVTGYYTNRAAMRLPLPSSDDPLNLDRVCISAKQYSQCLMARALPASRIRKLYLKFIDATEVAPLHLCVASYLAASPAMEEIAVEFVGTRSQGETGTSHLDWPSKSEANEMLLSALKASEGLRKIEFIGIPLELATSTCSLLQQVFWRCTHLTSLRFSVGSNSNSEGPNPFLNPLPGLSFLGSAIFMYCKNMETLEFQFDTALVENEDLSSSIKAYEAMASSSERRHKLRHLTINTGNTMGESTTLELPLSRKIQIARFLDVFFPTLSEVAGSEASLWNEVDLLVKSYQDQREKIVREVEGLLKSTKST